MKAVFAPRVLAGALLLALTASVAQTAPPLWLAGPQARPTPLLTIRTA
jgi:hypothetical protein